MTFNRNESQFSSKELNRILPYYILEEIDKEHQEIVTKSKIKRVSYFLSYLIFHYRILLIKKGM